VKEDIGGGKDERISPSLRRQGHRHSTVAKLKRRRFGHANYGAAKSLLEKLNPSLPHLTSQSLSLSLPSARPPHARHSLSDD